MKTLVLFVIVIISTDCYCQKIDSLKSLQGEIALDTLSYLNDSIVTKSHLYANKPLSYLISSLKIAIKGYRPPLPEKDTVFLDKIQVFFTDFEPSVFLDGKKSKIPYLIIHFSWPVPIDAKLLTRGAKDKLWSTKWDQAKANFYSQHYISSIEAGEY